MALAASFAAHLAVVLALPRLQIVLPVTVERVVELEVVQPEVDAEPEPAEEAPPEPAEPQEPGPPQPISPREAEFLTETLARSVPLVATPPPAVPRLRLPTLKAPTPESDVIPWEPAPRPVPEPLPRSTQMRAEAPAAPDLKTATALAEALLDESSSRVRDEQPRPAPPMRQLEIESQFGLERRVASAPAPPRVRIENPADVRIQFWVSPRGEVINTAVIQRGDPALDRAATEYVKKLRFNPLPPGEEQVQWGTIPVKFRLE
jgi:protein TonB